MRNLRQGDPESFKLLVDLTEEFEFGPALTDAEMKRGFINIHSLFLVPNTRLIPKNLPKGHILAVTAAFQNRAAANYRYGQRGQLFTTTLVFSMTAALGNYFRRCESQGTGRAFRWYKDAVKEGFESRTLMIHYDFKLTSDSQLPGLNKLVDKFEKFENKKLHFRSLLSPHFPHMVKYYCGEKSSSIDAATYHALEEMLDRSPSMTAFLKNFVAISVAENKAAA